MSRMDCVLKYKMEPLQREIPKATLNKQKMAEALAVDVRPANLPKESAIYDLISANNLDGICSLLNPLTLHNRQLLVYKTVSNKTLLGYACKLGFRNIVKYLLDECGADISERHTDLHISVSPLRVSIDNLDVSMVILLLSRGAVIVDKRDVRNCATYALNSKYISLGSILNRYINRIEPRNDIPELAPLIIDIVLNDNPDPILRASACGDIDRMKTLLTYGINAKGANSSENNALCVAILNVQNDAEHFLLNYRVFSAKDYVRALELCGAKFIVFRSDLDKGVRCWEKSLRIRNEYFFGVSDKLHLKSKTDLGDEFTSEEELNKLANDKAELYIQALIVCVRLLSPFGEVLHNAYVIVAKQPVFTNSLLRAISIVAELSEILYISESGVVDPLTRSMKVLESLLRREFHSYPSDMDDFLLRFRKLMDFINGVNWKVLFISQSEFHFVVHLKLLVLVLRKIIAIKHIDLCSNDRVWIKDGISRILRCQSDPYPTTLLHLTIEEPTGYGVIPFILSCSADANCTDNLKSTPMHVVARLQAEKSEVLHLVQLLADAGGHIDAVNKFNKTPFMTLKAAGVIENPLKFLSLQCLAAQTIHKYNIKVPEIYPKILRSFLKLHSQ